MSKLVKTIHALNWYYGNICVRQCPEDKQSEHYERMREIIRGHEDFLITYKMFIKVMREKHRVCEPSSELMYSRRNYWKLDHSGCKDFYRHLYDLSH
ncbi:hypothetical protein EBT31_19170 [bacterium]|nr:hypothetical protein [bacterium]NBX50536.1 hypothetical protein [bacterium]